MSDHTLELTDTNFDSEVIKTPGVMLVDFWATWCGPCKMLAPLLEEVAASRTDDVRIGKLETEANKATASRFNVRSLPTMVLFVDGVERARLTGLVSKTRIAGFIDQHRSN